MQFDVIVGNPPYQGPESGNAVYQSLWPRFWSKCLSLVRPGGIVTLITPLTWCSPTTDLSQSDAVDGKRRLWEVFNKFTSVANVTDLNKHFKGVGSTFSVVHVDTSGTDGLSFTDGFTPTLGFYPLSGNDRVESELSTTDNLASHCRISGKITDGIRVSVVKTRKITPENVEILVDGAHSKQVQDSLTASVYCKSMEEAEHVRKRILDCSDILYKHCRYNGFIDLQIMGMLKYEI